VDELAHHWFSASQPANAAKALDYARQAGATALAALAPDDAVRYFSRALRLAETVPDGDPMVGCDLLLALGEAERQAGLPSFRETFLDAAHRAQELAATGPPGDRRPREHPRFSVRSASLTRQSCGAGIALHALGDDDSRERALLLAHAVRASSLGNDVGPAAGTADAARAMARRLGDPDTVIRTLNLVSDPLQVPSTLAERMSMQEKPWNCRNSSGPRSALSGPAPTVDWPQCKPVTSRWRVGALQPCRP